MKRIAVVVCTGLLMVGGAACTKKQADEALVSGTTIASTSDTTEARGSSDTTTKSASGNEGATDTTVGKPATDSGDGSCPSAAEAAEIKASLDQLDFAEGDFDMAKLTAAMEQTLAMMEKYLPTSLQGDLKTATAAIMEYLDVLSAIDLSNPASITPEQMKELEDLSAKMETPEIETAMDNISKYFEENCGDVDLGFDS